MDVYNPIFGITWPGPGVFGIAIVLSMLLLGLIVYIILLYLKAKEKEKAHNYQLFLFQVKRKGLNNFQIKILNNMAAYLKLKSPTTLIKDANLFESILSGFSDYLKRNSLNIEENESICKELIVIYEKLYIPKMQYQTLYSMKDIEDGIISHRSAREIYKVVYDENTLIVDEEETKILREEERMNRRKRGISFEEFEKEWLKKRPPEEILEYYGEWPEKKYESFSYFGSFGDKVKK